MKINETSHNEHNELIHTMSEFFENEKPQVGIFWINFNTNNIHLFGVQKGDAELYDNGKTYTYPKLHKTYWQKQHHRAVAKGNKDSIFYGEFNYTNIPRGRIFVINNKFTVMVGSWYKMLDDSTQDMVSDMIQDEFNLPDDFTFTIDSHWDLGTGWSEEKF